MRAFIFATTFGLRRSIHSRSRSSPPHRFLAMLAPKAPEEVSFISAAVAAEIDRFLMGPEVGYSLDQLMELAGQSVAQGVHLMYPSGSIAVCCGPGNNGGDGLVAARHLTLLGRDARVILPMPSQGRFPHLEKQCAAHSVAVIRSPEVPTDCDVVVDAIFGFSFRPRGELGVGGELAQLIQSMEASSKPIVSVDCPSGWHVDDGDIYNSPSVAKPACVISLTAPKLCMRELHSTRACAHLVGGRFVPKVCWDKFSVSPPIVYEGLDVVKRIS